MSLQEITITDKINVSTHLPPRVVINNVSTEIDCGRYPVKACLNEVIPIQLNVFADGHDELDGNLIYRHQDEKQWHYQPLVRISEDRWQADLRVQQLGIYTYTFQAWVDPIATWAKKLLLKHKAKQAIDNEIKQGLNLLAELLKTAEKKHAELIKDYIDALKQQRFNFLHDEGFHQVIRCYPAQSAILNYKKLSIWVDRKKALVSAWYELFPRSLGKNGQHGNFKDVIARLDYIAQLGFDVLYLPPIHPIGITARKGKNDSVTATASEPGCPWAIGGREGGHMSIHPQLGTLQDFKALMVAARAVNLEIALDFAFQCSPDHPYLQAHPEWFKHNPDGSLQYAENPPKKYQDVYPFNFQSPDWESMWLEAEKILQYWIDVGVKIFRVDNPHTKPFAFWEWLLKRMKQNNPDVIFLAEAFTGLATMYELSKLGFTQSYTSFTWKTTKAAITAYMQEITSAPVAHYFRPNFWPNTPDILHASLHRKKIPAFMIRLILAATLSSNYGIYGPAFELGVNSPVKAGSEEYLNSEKYEIKVWPNKETALIPLIKKLNQLRQTHVALQETNNLQFIEVDNDNFLAYIKTHANSKEVLLIIVTLDPIRKQSGSLTFPVNDFPKIPRKCLELLTGKTHQWHSGKRYRVTLDPAKMPACIFKLR